MPVKQEVRRIADALPDDATWDDVMEQVYISQSIEAGLEAKKAGRLAHSENSARATASRSSAARWEQGLDLESNPHTSTVSVRPSRS